MAKFIASKFKKKKLGADNTAAFGRENATVLNKGNKQAPSQASITRKILSDYKLRP